MFDPDVLLQKLMDTFIYLTKKKSQIHAREWKPGERLKILFAGYAGARNTGGDVRVEEMIRQIRHILGDEQTDLSILTIDPNLTKTYFDKVSQVKMPEIFPPFLYNECPKHHGVIACEGSMFKSKFADALPTMMVGALGMANAEGKLSIGYGAEAGHMNPPLESFVKKNCKESLVICRNKSSEDLLEDFHIRTAPGTDTAWTFRPSTRTMGEELLKQRGWDGVTPILALGPIHPFCWPVRPSLKKSFERFFWNKHAEQHYKSVYFHHTSDADEQKFQKYISAIANSAKAFQQKHKVFPIIFGMEKLDRKACEVLANKFDFKPPVFVSDQYNMYDMVAILRCASMLVTSRFHAIVCSMGGLVPSAGITMDERIRNVMTERKHQHLLLNVDDDHLEEKLNVILETLRVDAEKISNEIGAMIPRQIRLMGEMGITFEDEVKRKYPQFPFKTRNRTWSEYLPPLDPNIEQILQRFA